MCLHYILPKHEKKKILDKIPEDGITVYKVALISTDGKSIPPYGVDEPYEGDMEARQIKLEAGNKIITGTGKEYMSGFHFFTTPTEAHRLKNALNEGRKILRYHVISATIKKEWITEIGTEPGINNAGARDWAQQETVIVTKKAIFN